MKLKFGPKTITINSIRYPRWIPGLRLWGPFRIPTPWRTIKIGGNRAAFGMLLFVAVGFGGTMLITHATTSAEMLWPEAGASYNLPDPIGDPLEPDITTPLEPSQTLKINLIDGVRLSSLNLENIQLGKASLDHCIQIERASGTSGFLQVDNFTLTGVSSPTFDMATVEASVLTLAPYADGSTMEASVDNTIPDLQITSTRGAGKFEAKDAVVDKIVITLAGSASVGTLSMTNISCHTGATTLAYIKAGALTIDNTSKFGAGQFRGK